MAEALADELDTDEFAAKFTKSFFFNRARPDLVIFRKDLDREEAKRLERDFVDKNRGFWRAFKPYFMPGELQIKELAANLRNIGLANLRAFERDMIVQVWGVPPEEESFIAIHRLARQLEPRMRDAFLDAADRMRESHGI